MDLTDARIGSAIQHSKDWQSAVTDLLAFFTQNRRCYSSGEVAAVLRIHRPDLVFSVPNIGKHLKEAFYNGLLPSYAEGAPIQTPRFTAGKYPDRSPPLTEVFVYGPDFAATAGHEFEVFVPRPGERFSDAPPPAVNLTSAQTGPGTAVHNAAVLIYGGKPALKELRATVWPDGRCGVPRSAFEAACHLGGNSLRAGDPIFVTVEPGIRATVTFADPCNGASKSYGLWKDQGRIAFSSPDKNQPFTPGNTYSVKVSAGLIEVDLANSVTANP